MLRPNEFIYRASHAVRNFVDNWENIAATELKGVLSTQWGENVVSKNPLFNDILRRLSEKNISRDERVKLITDIESLHSFNTMLNRTRRRDIQDFCVRRSFTVETNFTAVQYKLYTELLRFEYEALAKMYNVRSIPFMMSTIRRQASSCVFGLAPHIRSIIGRRFGQISDDGEIDFEEIDGDVVTTLKGLAEHILKLADNLPDDDPKFDIENYLSDASDIERQHFKYYYGEQLPIMQGVYVRLCMEIKRREKNRLRDSHKAFNGIITAVAKIAKRLGVSVEECLTQRLYPYIAEKRNRRLKEFQKYCKAIKQPR